MVAHIDLTWAAGFSCFFFFGWEEETTNSATDLCKIQGLMVPFVCGVRGQAGIEGVLLLAGISN